MQVLTPHGLDSSTRADTSARYMAKCGQVDRNPLLQGQVILTLCSAALMKYVIAEQRQGDVRRYSTGFGLELPMLCRAIQCLSFLVFSLKWDV